jgi:hypothetical protein
MIVPPRSPSLSIELELELELELGFLAAIMTSETFTPNAER